MLDNSHHTRVFVLLLPASSVCLLFANGGRFMNLLRQWSENRRRCRPIPTCRTFKAMFGALWTVRNLCHHLFQTPRGKLTMSVTMLVAASSQTSTRVQRTATRMPIGTAAKSHTSEAGFSCSRMMDTHIGSTNNPGCRSGKPQQVCKNKPMTTTTRHLGSSVVLRGKSQGNVKYIYSQHSAL